MNIKARKVTPERWKTVDFTRNVHDIARELGISSTTVYHKRASLCPIKERFVLKKKSEILLVAKQIRQLEIQMGIVKPNANQSKPKTNPSTISRYLGKMKQSTTTIQENHCDEQQLRHILKDEF